MSLILQITESSLPDSTAALRMASLLNTARESNSSHVAVLDELVEQLSRVNQQLAIQTIVRTNTSLDSSMDLIILIPLFLKF